MGDVWLNMALNLGVTFPDLLLFIVSLAGIVFFAIHFRVGLIMLFFSYVICFVAFYEWGYAYDHALILMFAMAAIMAVSFMIMNKNEGEGLV